MHILPMLVTIYANNNKTTIPSNYASNYIMLIIYYTCILSSDLTEHHLIRGNLRFHLSVYENEPTSIIAFALCSREYANELKFLLDEKKKGMTESTAQFPPTV